jgi:hypothetical protein
VSAWSLTAVPFAVNELLERGRALDHAARLGEPVDRAEAQEIVDSLSAYVASLPPDDQAEVAQRLVAELAKRMRFTPTVQPRARE